MMLRHVLTIALQTLTESRRNKVFYSIFLFALIVILNASLFTEVTITTMDRVLKDTGIAAINVFAIALTIFTGIGVINREIDRRSIYAVIVKPIARYEYILGKYLGLVAMLVTTCGAMFVCLLFAMKGYRAPITGSVFLGLMGIFLEVLVLGAVALLCSTFTNSMVSAFITVTVFVAGHLSSEMYFAAQKGSAVSRAAGSALYYVLPNLERFNFKYHVTYDLMISAGEMLSLLAYALAYVAAFLIAAVIVFSRRDFR